MTDTTRTSRQEESPRAAAPDSRLEDLVPLAVVIAAGCEPCAKRMVRRAIDRGCSLYDLRKTLGIVADMQRQDCLAKAVGADVIDRMERPLSSGKTTLQAELDRLAACERRTPC